MNDTNALIVQYAKQRHPLAASFAVEEAVELADQLRHRLGSSSEELSLSPASLKRLERKLAEWHHSLQQQNKTLTDQEVLQLVREIAAYFGLVLVHHASGQWRALGSLWTTEIQIEGPLAVAESHQRRFSPFPLLLSLGNQAATTWDLIVQGAPARLYKSFRRAKRKQSKGS
jgi:hypothetical protein